MIGAAQNPITLRCPACGAGALAPCRSAAGHVLVAPHVARLTACGTAPRSSERVDARAAYARRICHVFLGGDEASVLLAACRHGTIDPEAPWVQRIRAERTRRQGLAAREPMVDRSSEAS